MNSGPAGKVPRVACLGECMIELARRRDGLVAMGFGGDTLNTAIYLARLGIRTDYVTALGDDPESAKMLAAWEREGVGIGLVPRLPGRLPGLYLIDTDASGERQFFYWRDQAPARDLFRLPQTEAVCAALQEHDLLYLSGISLAIWGAESCKRLFCLLDAVRARGGRVAFDTNWRPRLWAGREEARPIYEAMLARTDIVLAGAPEMAAIFGDSTPRDALDRLGNGKIAEIVLKLEPPGCLLRVAETEAAVPAPTVDEVVDTTAAGDSFGAGYLAARLTGSAPGEAARAAHRLASVVVQHQGAIIPLAAMP